jgi:hypothetical protein
MSSPTDIANLSLAHLGISQEISDWEDERSKEAAAFRRFYELDRDALLRDFPWPFATRRVTLALEETDPVDEWGYSYRYPSGDVLALWEVSSGMRPTSAASRIAFELESDATGILLYTDQDLAAVRATYRVEDSEKFPSDFVRALSLLIASDMGPRLTKGDTTLADRAYAKYRLEVQRAWVNASRESAPTQAPVSEFERARD